MTLDLANEWPAALPLPYIDFSGGPRNATILSQVETANIQRRSRFTRSYNALQVSWVLTNAQYEAFRSFFETTLGCGTAQFKIELRFPKNSALKNWAVRFSTGHRAQRVDGMWQVQADLDLVGPYEF